LESLKGRDHLGDLKANGRKDNIKTNFKGIVCEGVDCIHMVQDRDQ